MPFTTIPWSPVEPTETVPQDAHVFLNERGWRSDAADPRNQSSLFTHPQKSGYYRWYEAVAMEFVGLARLGLDHNG